MTKRVYAVISSALMLLANFSHAHHEHEAMSGVNVHVALAIILVSTAAVGIYLAYFSDLPRKVFDRKAKS